MKTMLVYEWMRTDVITLNPERRVERVWELMERQRIRHLPVVKNGTLVGIIIARDLKRAVFPSPLPLPVRPDGLGTTLGVTFPFSRAQEAEADHIGLLLAAKAGYDPRAALAVWDRMETEEKKRPTLLLFF